jgi:enoyl-CoA hydratase
MAFSVSAQMSTNAVLYEIRNGIGLLTINRPEARNAVNGEVSLGIAAALDDIDHNNAVSVAILTGSGGVFCAGADLKAVEESQKTNVRNNIIIKNGGFAGLVRRARKKPLIAAVNGPAVGGGFEIVLACDLVVAAESASFALPEVKRSLLASAGALIRLPRLIGMARAMEMILTGESLSARRAFELGIINRVVPDGMVGETAMQLALAVAANAPLAVQASRQLASRALEHSDLELWREGFALANEILQTEDAKEGRRAFIERREPNWKAR